MLSMLLRDWTRRFSRFQWIQAMIAGVPGDFGIELRRRVLARYLASCGEGLVVYPGALIQGPQGLSVGKNCRIGLRNILQANGGIEMGDDVMLGPGVSIWSVNHVFARTDVPIWDQGYEHKKVVIGSGVWIGADSFVMPGARIGVGVVVSAGSVVSGKHVQPYEILAGNPARKVGVRKHEPPDVEELADTGRAAVTPGRSSGDSD